MCNTWWCYFPSVHLQNHKNTWTIKRLQPHGVCVCVCVCVCVITAVMWISVYTRGCRWRNVSHRSTSTSVTRGDAFIDPEKRLYSLGFRLLFSSTTSFFFFYFCSHFLISAIPLPRYLPCCASLSVLICRALNRGDEKWWVTLREVECDVWMLDGGWAASWLGTWRRRLWCKSLDFDFLGRVEEFQTRSVGCVSGTKIKANRKKKCCWIFCSN